MQTTEAKHILYRSKTPGYWFGAEYTMNLYRGCCHGCIYCDSRSDCYGIEDFAVVKAKRDALRILRDDIARKTLPGVVANGATSDPYNPYEKTENLTRNALQLLDAYGYGGAVATKSDLVLRDVDILQSIKTHSPVLCKITITTTDDAMAAKLEPYAPSSSRRFAALRGLADAGIFAGILLMPVMPWLTDKPDMIRDMVARAADAGARFIYPSFGVTARSGQREHMLTELNSRFPGEEMGARYRKRFGSRYHCTCPSAKSLWELFTAECDRHGILYNMQDIIRAYKLGYGSRQLSFF